VTNPLRVGIVGCGLIGTRRAENLGPNFDLVTVFDPVASSAEQIRHTTGSPVTIAPAVDDLLHSDIDVVIVATPHNQLAPITTKALRAGKHCFIEKPGGISKSEIADIAATARESGGTVRFGFNHRFHPAIMKTREIIASGVHGKVMSIRSTYGHGGRLGYDKEWRADRAVSGGGELVDQGSHLLDLTRFLCGPFELEYAHLMTSFWDMKVEDNAFLALQLESGGFGWLHASWTEWKNLFRLEVALERARIDVLGLGKSYGTETMRVHTMSPELGPPTIEEQTFDGPDQSWELEMQDFARAIAGQSGLGATCEDVFSLWSVIEEAYSR